MKACLAIPDAPSYPIEQIRRGLARIGIDNGRDPDADILVTWSPWNGSRRQVLQREFGAAGKPVIVIENGWLSPIGARPYYQIAFDGWNGTGRFPAGDDDRWRSWGLPMAPWRERGGTHRLIAAQRGHSADNRTMPPRWMPPDDPNRLPSIYRTHDSPRPLIDDLRSAAECHVWTSNVASIAVGCGIPVVYYGPNLMVSELASRPGEPQRRPAREPVMCRLAWAQWTADEISCGIPFKRLLDA